MHTCLGYIEHWNNMEAEYVTRHLQKYNRTNKYSTTYVTECLRNRKSIVFTKFGDGEVQCMQYVRGANCDGDKYTQPLGDELKRAFVKLCDMANKPLHEHDRILLGRWHCPSEVTYLAYLYWEHIRKNDETEKEIPFVNYHLIYNDDDFEKTRDLYELVKAIQDFPGHKVMISNSNNQRLQRLFRANDYIRIAGNSWYESEFPHVHDDTEHVLSQNPNALILIAGGLASKVLIARLCEKYPDASFLDIGSGFDILATRRCTRDHKHTYEAERSYYKDLLPEPWDA